MTAQLVSGVQMPLRLIPEAAAKRSDLSESASKHLGLAGFTQKLVSARDGESSWFCSADFMH